MRFVAMFFSFRDPPVDPFNIEFGGTGGGQPEDHAIFDEHGHIVFIGKEFSVNSTLATLVSLVPISFAIRCLLDDLNLRDLNLRPYGP